MMNTCALHSALQWTLRQPGAEQHLHLVSSLAPSDLCFAFLLHIARRMMEPSGAMLRLAGPSMVPGFE